MRQEWPTLHDIQQAYFTLVERYFAQPFAEMQRYKVSPHDVAEQLANREPTVQAFLHGADEMAAEFQQFWQSVRAPLDHHLHQLQGLKAVFGGDIAPSYTTNIVRSTGLYIDTILLPDPLQRIPEFFTSMRPHAAVYYMTKHALNILNYKSLALTRLSPPLLLVVPDYALMDASTRQMLTTSSIADLLLHSSKLFGRDFSMQEELSSFLHNLSGWETFMSRLVDPSRMLIDAESSAGLQEQLQEMRRTQGGNFDFQQYGDQWATIILMNLLGRMLTTNKLVMGSSYYHGTPLIDAPTSWQYLLWKYQYDSERGSETHQDMKDLFLSKVLQDLTLITDLPEQRLIDLRRRGALAELREILSRNIHEVDAASPSALAEVTQTVSTNLEEAFQKHKHDLDTYSQVKRNFGFDVGAFIATGSVTIAATSTGSIPLSLLALGLTLTVGAPSAKELWPKGKELVKTHQTIKRSPAGILFQQRKRKK
ncbi:hypothetical protein [Ktedonobacter racemifer]|uniref:Uncharacterized protein n=1 Tax=Ktedonobacter racemifer DSM 44963 TaxID=485913 RepID=D6TGS9_KTERA|nr:hypothetical protein [Ktedonobacter racemifer]EFH88858.1 conserved hypothetical protein [Ktedonobacter racemifer DSM 44963]